MYHRWPVMSPSRNCRTGTEVVAVSFILVFTLILLPSIAADAVGGKSSFSSSSSSSESTSSSSAAAAAVYRAEENAKKTVLGSKPPRCINKCMNCNPCEATLVIPHHQNKPLRESARREDDSYYLLSWKCKCGNKLFQP